MEVRARALEGELQRLREEMQLLRAESWGAHAEAMTQALQEVRRIAVFGKNVDLTRPADFFLMMYDDDIPYRECPSDRRGLQRSMRPDEVVSEVLRVRNSDARSMLHEYDAIAAAVASLCRHGPTNLVYVGANYGPHLLTLADFIDKRKLPCRAFGFEPGLAAKLLPVNVRMNRLEHIVTTYEYALSDVDSFGILNHRIGFSRDDKLLDDLARGRDLTSVVELMRFDTVAARDAIAGPAVIVIDTQGYEPLVITGCSEYMRKYPVVIVTEFTPSALTGPMAPADFLESLFSIGRVFDVPQLTAKDVIAMGEANTPNANKRLVDREILREHASDFCAHAQEGRGWTDLLVVPESVEPWLDWLPS
ncbi:MAG: FkbM family methyltransferase [Fimbriimonas ginsengisoli]|uniref:FkbM family methyltransferase n=1 Tax=Fimbriimonas ginsengisoli TaxID=1005039 RepID=A0A931LU67_FIMGI|nr:FkbM family methyltransferase [Fimbriimonas ginsengisoli]